MNTPHRREPASNSGATPNRHPAPPPDDPRRDLTVADADADDNLRHLAVVGDTYTILVSGTQTAGRYALIDMFVPPGGGPAPHRHDFEEMFHVLEGELTVTFRGQVSTAVAGTTVNIPANAPHAFHNDSPAPVRMLCMVSPAGLEEYFADFAEHVGSRTERGTDPSDPAVAERMARARALAPAYRIEVL